jgi:hypothetical protein
LHYDAILLGFLLQGTELLGSGSASGDVKVKANIFKTYPSALGDTEGAAKIEIAFHGDFDTLGRNAHRCSDHLASNLCAGGKRTKQEIAGTRGSSGTTDSGVSLRVVDGSTDIYRAGDGGIGLAALGAKSDSGGTGIEAVLVFEGFLQRANVHGNLIVFVVDGVEKIPAARSGCLEAAPLAC